MVICCGLNVTSLNVQVWVECGYYKSYMIFSKASQRGDSPVVYREHVVQLASLPYERVPMLSSQK